MSDKDKKSSEKDRCSSPRTPRKAASPVKKSAEKQIPSEKQLDIYAVAAGSESRDWTRPDGQENAHRRTTAAGQSMKLPPPPSTHMEPHNIQWSENETLDNKEDEIIPFIAVPVMEDYPLFVLRSDLSRPTTTTSPSNWQTALWTQSRGGTEVRVVKTFHIETLCSN